MLVTNANAPTHSANSPHSPLVTVLFGGEDSVDVGMVRIEVPAGAKMPAHRHNGSDVILTPLSGAVLITKDETTVDLGAGDALLILKDETVALSNPHQEPAELIVAAGPATFISTVRSWPLVSNASATPA